MKKCFKCKRIKPLRLFYKHPMMGDGHLGKCKTCTKKDVARWYRKTKPERQKYEAERFKRPERKAAVREYARRMRHRNRGKQLARSKLAAAVLSGKMKRLPCQVCGDPKSEGHHPDYRRPLYVKWLCFKHHREEHGQKVD